MTRILKTSAGFAICVVVLSTGASCRNEPLADHSELFSIETSNIPLVGESGVWSLLVTEPDMVPLLRAKEGFWVGVTDFARDGKGLCISARTDPEEGATPRYNAVYYLDATGRKCTFVGTSWRYFVAPQWSPRTQGVLMAPYQQCRVLVSQDPVSGKAQQLYVAPHGTGVPEVRVSPDGRYLALTEYKTPGKGAELKMVDLETGRRQRVWQSDDGHTAFLNWSPDSQRLFWAGWGMGMVDAGIDAAHRLYRAQADTWETRSWPADTFGFDKPITTYDWGPDGRMVRSETQDDITTVFVFEPGGHSERKIAELTNASWLSECAWSPDGQSIAVTTATSFKPLQEQISLISPQGEVQRTIGPVYGHIELQWTPDSRYLVLNIRGSVYLANVSRLGE